MHVLRADEEPKCHQVMVQTGKPEMTGKESLELLDRQNEGLATGKWVNAMGSNSRDAMSSHFMALIYDRPLEALTAPISNLTAS
jgi:hypothetical protein